MSFTNSALIQKLTQRVDELYQRVVVLEGGKSVTKHTGKTHTLEPIEGSEDAPNVPPKGSTKELQGVSDV